jgi:hypothetical protein
MTDAIANHHPSPITNMMMRKCGKHGRPVINKAEIMLSKEKTSSQRYLPYQKKNTSIQ